MARIRTPSFRRIEERSGCRDRRIYSTSRTCAREGSRTTFSREILARGAVSGSRRASLRCSREEVLVDPEEVHESLERSGELMEPRGDRRFWRVLMENTRLNR